MKNRLRIKFENTLRRCYFCKDRQYRSDSERAFSESALRKLWALSEINVKGVRYKRNEIRRQMFNEMMPETVDNALQYFREMNLPMTADALAEKIFEYTVAPNEAVPSCPTEWYAPATQAVARRWKKRWRTGSSVPIPHRL